MNNLLSNQFSKANISDISAADKTYLQKITYQSRLLSNNQQVSFLTPLKATVVNNQGQFIMNYQITLT